MVEVAREAKLAGRVRSLVGADYAITGDVVEFGRNETGDTQLFVIFGSGKKQARPENFRVSSIQHLSIF